jgi:ATP-binding protein involved in chromosome partitioning
MFRQLKVPVLGMIENMSFFDVVAYLRDRGGPEAHRLIDSKSFFDTPGDERVYIFGRGGAKRKAEAMGVPFLGEVPLNVFLRETGDEGRMAFALAPGSPSRPYLLGVVEQLAAQISIQNIKTPKMPKLEILG